jgi:hypothetical protein
LDATLKPAWAHASAIYGITCSFRDAGLLELKQQGRYWQRCLKFSSRLQCIPVPKKSVRLTILMDSSLPPTWTSS